MLYKDIPFLNLTGSLLLGILLGNILPPSSFYIYISAALFILLSILILLYKKRVLSSLFGLLLMSFLILSGISLYHSRMERLISLPEEASDYILRADEGPEKREKTYSLPATIISYNGIETGNKHNKIMLYLRDTVECISPGDIISATITSKLITDFDTTDNFDYQRYMNRKGFKYLAFVNHGFTITSTSNTVNSRALRIRMHLLSTLSDSGLSDNSLALTAALTLGYRDLLESDITENFRRAGITHILAVSGLHIGILSLLVLSLLSFIRGRFNYIRVVLTILIIWTFALITGLSPSVTRAALMFTFIFTGRLIQRRVNSINSLLASAFVILLINPSMIFDVGFELSYSAVLFILLFYRDLSMLITVKSRIVKWIWDMIIITLLAQLGTLPFIIYHFKSVPLLSLITNFVAIPSLFIILGGGVLIILSSPIPLIPKIAVVLVDICSNLLIRFTEAISTLSFASVSLKTVSIQHLFIMIIILPLIVSYLLKRESVHIHLLLGSLIISLVVSLI